MEDDILCVAHMTLVTLMLLIRVTQLCSVQLLGLRRRREVKGGECNQCELASKLAVQLAVHASSVQSMTLLTLRLRSSCSSCNDSSWVTVVDVCRGCLVQVQVGARRGTEIILLHLEWTEVFLCADLTALPG